MKNKRVALIILDGYGVRKESQGNAIANAKKPNIDKMFNEHPHTLIEASGKAVGLPEGQMGNSEVGHLNISAGRVVYTGLSLINNDIEVGKFFKNEALLLAIDKAKKNNSKIHLMGLVSSGGVHSTMSHLYAIMDLLKKHETPFVLHAFADGRDVAFNSFARDIKDVEQKLKTTNGLLGSVSGRYYAMDRDQRWDRIELAYNTLIGKGSNAFTNVESYINASYGKKIYDEFLEPAINASLNKEDICLSDNDSVIFFNFRPDRARQMCHMFTGSTNYNYKPSTQLKNITLVTMMVYEGSKTSAVAYPPLVLKNTLGEVIADNGLSQLRIAETEKYAHVTFFFDGGVNVDFKNEEKILIPSPKVATYDLAPRMSADAVCDGILEKMNKVDLIIANFANPDMVGHTGNLKATVEAIECIDELMGKILKRAAETKTTLFVTADHGNADEVEDGNGLPFTKHTTSPVFFLSNDNDIEFVEGGCLGNIAPTILKYMGLEIPKDMNLKSLIK